MTQSLRAALVYFLAGILSSSALANSTIPIFAGVKGILILPVVDVDPGSKKLVSDMEVGALVQRIVAEGLANRRSDVSVTTIHLGDERAAKPENLVVLIHVALRSGAIPGNDTGSLIAIALDLYRTDKIVPFFLAAPEPIAVTGDPQGLVDMLSVALKKQLERAVIAPLLTRRPGQ